MSLALEILILLSGALCVYAWLVFPLLLRRAARNARPWRTDNGNGRAATVGVVLSAHNEAAHIADRIHNLVAESPSDRPYEVHIGVDASTDDTARAAQRAAAGRTQVQVHVFAERRGKVAVIKDLVARCRADILIFTDANTYFAPGAVTALLAPLADPAVGGVCGRLALVEALPAGGLVRAQTDAHTDEGFYWRWETSLKTQESALDSCLGANGAIFAMRRELFWNALPGNTMVDDFVIGMKVREQGARVVYEPEAVAVEELPHLSHEWGRRVRIGAGDYQALTLCRRCLLPRYGWFAWCFWSHKVLRWFTPHAVLLMAICAVAALVIGSPCARQLGAVCLAGFGLIAVLALLGAVAGNAPRGWARLPALCLHFVSMQAALFAGFLRYVTGNLTGHWTRTPRRAGAA
ncbi:MAG: glycosyltransferase [Verrucomicrobia bacterium]|nr:glycosyltransferase [Verrucomicrobiota bacterium]